MTDRGFPSSEMHHDVRGRFLAKLRIVDDDTSCWEWTAYAMRPSRANPGTLPYGVFRIGGRKGRTFLAHRLAWEMANGREVPAGMKVLHDCDNARCVRHDHLRVGTQRENVHDQMKRGRWTAPRGFAVGRPGKLTADDVRAILKSGESSTALASTFSVTFTTIRAIRNGTSWRHIPRPVREAA